MAVVSVRERRERSAALVGTIQDRYATRTWLIEVDDPLDDEFDVGADALAIAALPGLFSAHPKNPFYTCRRVILEDTESQFHRIARAEYSTAPFGQAEEEAAAAPDPKDRPIVMDVDTVEFERYQDTDRNGDPRLNSAGDKYPASPVEDSRPLLRLSKHVADWSTTWMWLNNTLNADTVQVTDGVKTLTIPAETGQLKRVKVSERKTENGHQFYTVSCEVHAREDAADWREKLLDEGFHYFDLSRRKRITLEDDDGNQVFPAEPQLLDGAGGILDPDGDPAWNEFDMIRTADWFVDGFPFFTGAP